jgi:hypothetical protein
VYSKMKILTKVLYRIKGVYPLTAVFKLPK